MTLIEVRDIMYRLSFEELLFGRAVSENPGLSLRSQSKKKIDNCIANSIKSFFF